MAVREKAQRLIDAVNQFASPSKPQTVRACYYHLVTTGLLPSCVESYNTVKSTLTNARRAGSVPYAAIVDNGRRSHLTPSWDSLEERAESAKYIRLNPWIDQPDRLGIVIEKDAAMHLVKPV